MTIASLWNAAGGLAKAFGYPFPMLPGDVVTDEKNFLDEVNKSSPVEGLKEYKKSGFELNKLKDFKEFVEDLESKGMMRHCLQEFDKKALKSSTWQSALKRHVLTDLAKYEKQVTFISVNLNLSLILYKMRTYKSNADVQEYGCRALWNGTSNDDNKVNVAREIGITTILSAMTFHADNATVQQYGCGTIANLALNDDNKVKIAVAEGGITTILCALNNHSYNASLQHFGCGALLNLAMNDNNRVTIAQVGGITTILSAMETHLSNAKVQEYGLGALVNLALNDKNKMTIAEAGGITSILSAMRIHSYNANVQYSGCGALLRLAENIDDCCRRMYHKNYSACNEVSFTQC